MSTKECFARLEDQTCYNLKIRRRYIKVKKSYLNLQMTKTNKMMCSQQRRIRVFDVRMNIHWVLSYPLSAQQRLWSNWANAQTDLSRLWADWANAQTDLSLGWGHRSFCWFCHVQAHLLLSGSREKVNNNDHNVSKQVVSWDYGTLSSLTHSWNAHAQPSIGAS